MLTIKVKGTREDINLMKEFDRKVIRHASMRTIDKYADDIYLNYHVWFSKKTVSALEAFRDEFTELRNWAKGSVSMEVIIM